MYILNCEEYRDEMLSEAKGLVKEIESQYSRKPKLVVVQVEGDDASNVYVRNKKKMSEECGIEFEHILLPSSVEKEDLEKCLKGLNKDAEVTGVLLQLPLPSHLREHQESLLNLIDWKKDVDGLTVENMGRLWSKQSTLVPCTAGGIMRLLPSDLSGLKVSVINRSPLIGIPLVALLQGRNATVTLAHSKTGVENIKELCRASDLIITATGRPKSLKFSDVSTGTGMFAKWNVSAIIDAGISRDENGKLCGDIDLESFDLTNITCTPTPKGTGILTVAQLMLNVCYAFKMQKEENYEKI